MKRHIVHMTMLLFLQFSLSAADYCVSPLGNDADAGDEANPWKTIQHAADSVSAGDTIYVRGGIYHEQVNIAKSGSLAGGYITLKNYAAETPVIDGSTITPSVDNSAMVTIQNQNYVIVQGFEIRSLGTSNQDVVPMGIYVTGYGDHLQILDNYVHHIEANNVSRSGGNAHGIAVYATDGANPVSNLTVSGNTVSNCKLGWSESMVLNGNVNIFTVTCNTIHDNNNIGIDLIGYEGTAPSNDQTRNGTVSRNLIYNISSRDNPAYTDLSAGGIYVDGGKDIFIERNMIYEADIGIEIGCEHAGKTVTGITVRNNILFNNNITGLGFGGYATNMGIVTGCKFEHNTLYMNDTTNSGTGEMMIQRSHDNTVSNNIIYCSDQNIFLTNYFTNTYSYANTFNYNLYFTPGDEVLSQFIWQNKEYLGLPSFKTASGQESNSVSDDPDFADTLSNPPDFHLNAGSPAINSGDPAFVTGAGETDYFGNARIVGGRTDIGASENGAGGAAVLTMVASPGASGNINPAVGAHNVDIGVSQAITADPLLGFAFVGWTGDANASISSPSSKNTSVILSGDSTVTANFAIIPLAATLTMSVSPADSGTTAPDAGQHVVATLVPVDITATAADGFSFSNWTVSGNAVIADANSAVTTVTLSLNSTVTANFVADGTPLSLGSVVEISAGDFGLASFTSKPKIFGVIDDTYLSMSVVGKVSSSSPKPNINAEWKKKFKIYDTSVYNKDIVLSTIINATPIRDKSFDIQQIEIVLDGNENQIPGTFLLANMVVSSTVGAWAAYGDQFTVKGTYFGSTAPTVYVECLTNGDVDLPKYRKCKVVRELSYPYKNASGTANKSCMKIYDGDVDLEDVGYSQITVSYPKLVSTDQPTGYIILDNGIGLTAYQLR